MWRNMKLVTGIILGLLLGSVLVLQAQNFSSVQVGSGSTFAPSITFLSDNKKGFYDNGTNSIGAAVNQLPGLTISQSTAQDVEVAVRNHLVTNRLGDTTPAAPTGMGTSTILGNDTAGVVTIGTGGTGPLVLTFAKAYLVQPVCWFHDQTTNLTGTTVGKVATTTTTATWTPPVTTVTADKISYFCIGTG